MESAMAAFLPSDRTSWLATILGEEVSNLQNAWLMKKETDDAR